MAFCYYDRLTHSTPLSLFLYSLTYCVGNRYGILKTILLEFTQHRKDPTSRITMPSHNQVTGQGRSGSLLYLAVMRMGEPSEYET